MRVSDATGARALWNGGKLLCATCALSNTAGFTSFSFVTHASLRGRQCRRPVDIANMATPAEHFVQYFKQRGITSLIDNAEVEDADAEVDIEDAEVVIVAWSGSLFKFPRDAADALQQCKGVAYAGSGLLQTEKACSCGSGFYATRPSSWFPSWVASIIRWMFEACVRRPVDFPGDSCN